MAHSKGGSSDAGRCRDRGACNCGRTITGARSDAPPAAAGDCSEEYVWVGALSTLPLFQARDFPALQAHAKELGVCARVSGPATFDVPGELAAIEQECAGQPAGIMVLGLDASLASAIDKCIDAKVPVVTVDVDVPGSKRLSMIGDDSVKLGKFLAQKIPADLIRRGITSGSIAITAALTNPSTLVIIDNFKAELANQTGLHPGDHRGGLEHGRGRCGCRGGDPLGATPTSSRASI